MKKLVSLLIVLSIVCFSVTAFAVPYSEAEVKFSVEFEGLTNDDLGSVVGEFDPHGDWQLTEGVASIVEGNNGNGLAFTPKYDNPEGYASCVMRAYLPIIMEQKAGFTEAYGLRFYVRNDTWYEVCVTPMLCINADDGTRAVFGPGLGSYIVDMEGEYEYPNLVAWVDSCSATISIPSYFEGYIVLPFSIPGGEVDEYDCGWQTLPGWTTNYDYTAEDFFGKVTDFMLDVRVNGFQVDDTESVVFDSFEFFGVAGEEVELPEGEMPETSDPATEEATTAPTEEVTTAPTEEATSEATEEATPEVTENGTPANTDNTGLIIIIAVAAAVIIAAVIVIIVVQKKKKAQ